MVMNKTFLFLFLLPISAYSQEIQIQTAINEALKYSPVVQRSKANMEDAQWRKAESYNGLLPTVTGDINYLLAKKYVQFDAGSVTINQVLPSSQFILTGNLPVFDGFSNFNRLHAGARQFDAAENDYEWTEFTISMQTALLFCRALVARNLMDVADQNEKTIQDHYKDVTALQRVGVATKFDVLRVGVQVNEAEAEVLKAHDEYDFAKIRLARTIGKEEGTRTPVGDFPMLAPGLIEETKEQTMERKDILALSKQSESLTSLQKANSKFWVPRLSVYGQVQAYNNRNDEFSDWDAYREAYQMGLNLRWNIFDGMTSISKSKQARAQAIAAQNGVRAASLKAGEDADIWKKTLLYFCKMVNVKTAQTQKKLFAWPRKVSEQAPKPTAI